MQSPLSGLCEVLKLVRSSASSYREQLQRNEAVTRAVLIDPVLRALGWDVANPANVEVERPISEGKLAGKLDYCLSTDNQERPIVVEAKKLGESLEGYFSQIVQYACTLKIENLFLTDGLKWFHFTEVSASNHKPTASIDLSKAEGAELTKAAAFFVERLDAALYTPETQSREELLQGKIDSLERKVKDMEKIIHGLDVGSPQTIISAEVNLSDQWLEIGDDWDAKKKKPARLRLPNGEIVSVRSWTQILTETCKYCLFENKTLLNQLPISDRTGRATKLLSFNKPPSNLNSDSFTIGDQTVYVCTNYSANDVVANSSYLLSKFCGASPVKAAILLAD
jgi:hypothetical protein